MDVHYRVPAWDHRPLPTAVASWHDLAHVSVAVSAARQNVAELSFKSLNVTKVMSFAARAGFYCAHFRSL